jgi:hypothetical protein
MMKKRLIVLGAVVCIGMSGLLTTAQLRAETTRFEQYISPKECVKEEVNNGISTSVILTPQECEELLNPEPPKPPKEPENPRPPIVVEGDGVIRSPNTGFMQRVTDAVVENRDVIFFVFIAVGVALFVVVVRRASRRKLK